MTNNEARTVKSIRQDYEVKERTKTDELVALDKKVQLPAYIFAYTFGVIASLIAGVGMCLGMGVIGASLGAAGFVFGIIIGIIGFACAGINYPIFTKILDARRAKYREEILTLADEIAAENN